MKTKKLSKKLTLNKNTIANLIDTDMKKIHAGACDSIIPDSQCTGDTLCSVHTCPFMVTCTLN
jgi:hypothetical protein